MFDPIDYALHYGGRCRDCADADGVCPSSGIPCDPSEARKAAGHILKAWSYGIQHGYMENPFSAALAHPGQVREIAIKPLEWGSTSYGRPEVNSVVGVYRINEAWNGGWSLTFKNEMLRESDGRSNFATIDAAKAAAQVDFGQRIRSALALPLAVQESEPVDWDNPDDPVVSLFVGYDVEDYVEEYEFCGDGGDYSPNEQEKTILVDAIYGVVSDLHGKYRAISALSVTDGMRPRALVGSFPAAQKRQVQRIIQANLDAGTLILTPNLHFAALSPSPSIPEEKGGTAPVDHAVDVSLLRAALTDANFKLVELQDNLDQARRRTSPAVDGFETRYPEAGFVEFINYDAPYIVRDIPAPAAILTDMETRQIIGYRVYDPASAREEKKS